MNPQVVFALKKEASNAKIYDSSILLLKNVASDLPIF
jgi:hypothetical protein